MIPLLLLLARLRKLYCSIKRWLLTILVLLIAGLSVGCHDGEAIRRDREHNNAVQKQLAEAAKQLITAEAQARQDFLKTQNQLEVSRQAIVGQQKDVLSSFDRLENERRQIASERMIDSLLASGIESAGLITAVLVPFFLLAWIINTACQTKTLPEMDAMVLEYRILAEETPLLAQTMGPGDAKGDLAKLEQKEPSVLNLPHHAIS